MNHISTVFFLSLTAFFGSQTYASSGDLTMNTDANGLAKITFSPPGASKYFEGLAKGITGGKAARLTLVYPSDQKQALLLPTSNGDKLISCSPSNPKEDKCSSQALLEKWQRFELGDDPATLATIQDLKRVENVTVVMEPQEKAAEMESLPSKFPYMECEILDPNLIGDKLVVEAVPNKAIGNMDPFPGTERKAAFVIRQTRPVAEGSLERGEIIQFYPVGAEGVKYSHSFLMEQIAESELHGRDSILKDSTLIRADIEEFGGSTPRYLFRSEDQQSPYLKALGVGYLEMVCMLPFR